MRRVQGFLGLAAAGPCLTVLEFGCRVCRLGLCHCTLSFALASEVMTSSNPRRATRPIPRPVRLSCSTARS